MKDTKGIIEALGITKGPWEVGDITKNESPAMIYCDDITGSRIADCTNRFVQKQQGDKRNNARLIAASPEMLEALIAIFDFDGELGFDSWVHVKMIIEKAANKSWSEIKEIIK